MCKEGWHHRGKSKNSIWLCEETKSTGENHSAASTTKQLCPNLAHQVSDQHQKSKSSDCSSKFPDAVVFCLAL